MKNRCISNRNGYVFSKAGGRTGDVLHKVDCRHLNIPFRRGIYTTCYHKYCSGSLKD